MANPLIRACVELAISVASTPAYAGGEFSGEDTLRFYLSKASLVVSGEIDEMLPILDAGLGTWGYSFTLKVKKVLKGELLEAAKRRKKPPGWQGEVIEIGMRSYGDDTLPFMKEGGRVILFLREEKGPGDVYLREADPVCGIHQGSLTMETLLKRVMEEDAKETRAN